MTFAIAVANVANVVNVEIVEIVANVEIVVLFLTGLRYWKVVYAFKMYFHSSDNVCPVLLKTVFIRDIHAQL